MISKYYYRAKSLSGRRWVYGNYVDQVNGCKPIIVTNVWAEDDGSVSFDYQFVDGSTVERVNFQDTSKWEPIFGRTEALLNAYENSHPKMDELMFVNSVCDENNINRKEALWVIRELRKKHKCEYKKKK